MAINAVNSSNASGKASGIQQIEAPSLLNYKPTKLVAESLQDAIDVNNQLTKILGNVSQGLDKASSGLRNVLLQIDNLSSKATSSNSNVNVEVDTTAGSLYYDLCILMPTNPNTANPCEGGNQPSVGTISSGQLSLSAGDLQAITAQINGDIQIVSNKLSKASTILTQNTNFGNKLIQVLSDIIKISSTTQEGLDGNI